MQCAKKSGVLRYASDRLKDDKEVVMAAISVSGYAYEYASDRLKRDLDVALEVVAKLKGRAIEYIPTDLYGNYEFMLKIVKSRYRCISNAKSTLLNNKEFIMDCINFNPRVVKFLGCGIYQKDVVVAIIKLDPTFTKRLTVSFFERNESTKELLRYIIEHIPELIWEFESFVRRIEDVDITKLAVKKWGMSLRYIHKNVRNDKDLVLMAVDRDGLELNYASGDLKNDIDVVLAAVSKDGRALEYVNYNSKTEEVCLIAVKKHPTAFNYIRHEMYYDYKFILELVRHDKYFECITNELKKDVRFMTALIMTDPYCQ